MGPLITSNAGILAVCCMTVAFSLFAMKVKGLKKLGPALICILIGILLSNVGIMPKSSDVYSFMGSEIIYLSIAILLLNVDIKQMLKLSKQPLLAMVLACVVVSVVAIVGGLVFAPMIGEEGWKVAGMFVGTYTGGSSNLNAIAAGLETSADIVAGANAADYVVYTPFIIMMMTMATTFKDVKWFNKFWPYHLEEDELKMKGGSDFLKAKEWSIQDIAWLVGIGFAIVGVSTFLATFAPAGLGGTFKIIFITTLGILVAQVKRVRELRGISDLGLYFSLFYLTKIGLEIDLVAFVNSAWVIAIFCVIVMFVSFLLHALLCRVFKIKWQYVIVSMQAAIGSSSSASALAVTAGWETLISVAVILGVFGNAVGNYLGFAVAYALKAMLGM